MIRTTLRVIALGESRLPFVDPEGREVRGRHAGRDRSGKPAAEEVPENAYYLRAIDHGDLELAPEVPPSPAPAPSPEAPQQLAEPEPAFAPSPTHDDAPAASQPAPTE